MSANDQLPSKDPADELSLGGAFRAIFAKMMQKTDGMLPARVVSYDREANVATVQPMVAVLTTGGERVARATVARVPVLALGGGGFVVNFPLQAGDLGWIEASDRDISLFMQSLDESAPNTVRLHSFEDSRFIPDVFREFTLAEGVGDDEMVVQSTDGAVVVSLSPTRVRVRAPEVVIDADAGTVRGPFTFENLATFEDDIEVNGIRFSTHKHTGVQTGGGTTGGPTS